VASFEKPFALSMEEATTSGRLRSMYLGAPGSGPDIDADSPCGPSQLSHCLRLMNIQIQQFLLLALYILSCLLYHDLLRCQMEALKLVLVSYIPL